MADDARRSPVPRHGGAPDEPTHAADPPADAEALTRPGERWGDLHLVAEIGRGATGRVFRAWDPALDREVALKISRVPAGPRRASMLREGRLLARVRHPHVVTVHGAQQIGDEIGVWMELVQGRTLAQIVRDSGPMGPEEATVIGVTLCRALAAVHVAGLIHRDVKAQNVMRESGGRIVLMDFGAGRDAADEAGARDYSGTPLYMAPELFRGESAMPASDIYSLGVLLFHLVSGAYPVDGRSVTDILMAHRDGRRMRLADRRPDLPAEFVRVVERAIASQPQSRPQTAGALLHDLVALLPQSAAARVDALDAPEDPGARSAAATLPASAATHDIRAPGLWARWAIAAIAAFVAVGVLGFLMSAAFDMALGREAGFSDDTPADWWIYGARSLVAPAVYIGLAIIVVRVAAAAWDLAVATIPPLRRWHERGRAALTRTFDRSRGPASTSAAARVLLVQAVGLAVLLAIFTDVVGAFPIWVSTAPAESLAVLRPSNTRLQWYRSTLTLSIFAMALSWYLLRRRGYVVDWGSRLGGIALLAIAILLLEVPWRLIYKSQFERVEYAGARCYAIGRREHTVLLFCPDSPPPRNMQRPADDPALRATGEEDDIFGPAK